LLGSAMEPCTTTFEDDDILLPEYVRIWLPGHTTSYSRRMEFSAAAPQKLQNWHRQWRDYTDRIEALCLCSVTLNVIKLQTHDIKDSVDDTWIISAQSPVQRELLDAHPHNVSIFVEGAFRIWLRNASVAYFILRADPGPKPNLPAQDIDGTYSILICNKL
jgi:hypothetical protein